MFERLFQWALGNGVRLLFGATVVILVAGLLRTVAGAIATNPNQQWMMLFAQVLGAVHDAAWPFAATLIAHWLERHRPASVSVVPSWLVRSGPYILLGLSLVFFAWAAVAFVLWLNGLGEPNMPAFLYHSTWLAPLWSASVLFGGVLVLQRLNAAP